VFREISVVGVENIKYLMVTWWYKVHFSYFVAIFQIHLEFLFIFILSTVYIARFLLLQQH